MRLALAGGDAPPHLSAGRLVSRSSGSGEQPALHLQPRLVGAGLPAIRDDRGSDAVPAAQEDEAGRGGGTGEGRGGGVLQPVLRGRQVHVQAGRRTVSTSQFVSCRFHPLILCFCPAAPLSYWSKTLHRGWAAGEAEPKR